MKDGGLGPLLSAAKFVAPILAASCGAVHAQALTPDITFDPNNTEAMSFDRGENVSVLSRPRPDYQAAGLHVGGFMVYPKVTASLAYDDNIFALQSGAVGDEIFTIAPEVDFQSTWSRNSLAGYIRAAQNEYFHYASEDTTEYGAGLSGKYEFGNASSGEANFTGSLDWGHYARNRLKVSESSLSRAV